MKIEKKQSLLEVVLMFVLCMILVECTLYLELPQELIYLATGLSVVGTIISKTKKMQNFDIYFVSAGIATIIEPSFWVVIHEGWNTLWTRIQGGLVPFAFPVYYYIVAGIAVLFISYTAKRLPVLIRK